MIDSTQLAYRTPKNVGILKGPPLYETLETFESVTIVQASTGKIVTTLPVQNSFELGFSPLGTYIITWERPSKEQSGDAKKNLKVWKIEPDATAQVQEDEHVVGRFVQKSATNWNLQYTKDEAYCARVVTNEVHFYESTNLSHVWKKLRVEGVTDFALSPGPQHAIAIFSSERKGLPASVKIFRIPEFDVPLSQKTFFKGDKAQLKWNADGTSLIVLAQTEVDRSGKSYYGETTLYLLSANGGFDSRLDLDKDGPVHDVAWSPNSREFGVIYGYMPAKTVLFNAKAVATHTFPLGPRNTMLFAPRGRHLLVAGFGNLAGQVDIYDLEKNHEKVSTIEASNASLCEWCPDGTHILTATTSPRLRVDNGIKIWHLRGKLLFAQDMQELYHVDWRPQPHTHSSWSDALDSDPIPHPSAATYLSSVKTPQKSTGAYRPPGARGQLTPLAFKREDEGGAAYISNGSLSNGIGPNAFARPRRREVPGAEVADGEKGSKARPEKDEEAISKSAAKNRKKREAKKSKESVVRDPEPKVTESTREGADPTIRQVSTSSIKAHDLSQDRAQFHHHQAGLDQEVDRAIGLVDRLDSIAKGSDRALSTSIDKSTVPSPHEKRIRALLKKLRAIDDLKMRRAGGEQLEATQIKKMDTEESVRKELNELGFHNE